MSFIKRNATTGKTYAPGYFLAHQDCTRVTYNFKADDKNVKTADNGGKYIPMGTVISDAEGYVKGIAYEDVDVTYGDMPGSLVVGGTIYEDRLTGDYNKDNLEMAGGFNVISKAPAASRPDEFDVPTEEEQPAAKEAESTTTEGTTTEGGNA